MAFDWTTFLVFSRGIEKNPEIPGPREAACRSAASRAYYAVYHNARIKAESEDFHPFRTGQDHFRVRNHFLNSSDRNRKKIGTGLGKLKGYRTSADYKENLGTLPDSLAKLAIGIATEVIDTIENL